VGQPARAVLRVVAVLLAIAWPLVVLSAGETMLEVFEWSDVVGETTFAVVILLWVGGLLRADIPGRALWPITLGALCLFLGAVPDVMDEFFVLHGTWVGWVENLAKVGGSALITVGAFTWLRIASDEVEELEASSARFETLSITDPLTGLYNRAHLADVLPRLVSQIEAGRPLSLLMLDIDDFKDHNDTWGHPEGDKVIATLADVIRNSIRETDVAIRYGGEEFAVILPGADLERARIAAERIRLAFAHRVFTPQPGVQIHKTVSLGVARANPNDSASGLIERADDALYAAKHSGKDRVVAAA